MPNATILSPRTGDTVNKDNVPISVAYANFTAATDLKCKIKDGPDNAENVNGAGLHSGTATTTELPEFQTVTTGTDAGGELSRQENVKVTSGETPNPIDEPVVEDSFDVKSNKKKLKKVGGRVPNTSTATRVVCTLYRVDARDGTTTQVGIPLESPVNPVNHKWDVNFNVDLDQDDYIQYFVRVCSFQNTTPLGCESRPVKKK